MVSAMSAGIAFGEVADQFAVRMRAYAAAHLSWDDTLVVTWQDASAILQSEYTGGDDGRAYAVTIHGEIRGSGESLQEAEQRLATALADAFPLIAVAANAAVADPLMIASYGLDLASPQPFIGYRTPSAWEWFPPGRRLIDVEATLAFMTAVRNHPQTDLLRRTIEAYRRALSHWVPEHRLMAGEFLFIASETLSRFVIESRAADRGMTPKNLARLVGSSDVGALRRQYLTDEIFGLDKEAFEAMEAASNGFEHGYMAVSDVRGLLEPVLERSMRLVRRALIGETGVSATMRERLLAAEYDEPRGLVPMVPFVYGELERADPNSPAPEMRGGDVELEWNNPRPVATRSEDGEVTFSFPFEVKFELPPNTQARTSGFAMRAAYMKRSEAAPVDATAMGGESASEEDETQEGHDG
jgi:hypothetical protein